MFKFLLLSFFITNIALAQAVISGTVKDQTGAPVANASIKAGNKTTLSGADGTFSIEAVVDALLSIDAQGYNTVTIKASNNMVVSLIKQSKPIEEVIITGYQNISRRRATGSSTVIGIDDVRTQPVASFDQLLQGQAAGLNVKTGSGQPGRSADVVIRGKGSINGSTSPLYIVDGIEVRPGDFSTMNQGDFESVTVLKDAASTGIYGSRGANGVIVVTTKRGRAGKLKLNYDVQYGSSQLPKNQLELMNTQEKLDFEMNIADNPWGWSDAQVADLRKINVNWDDYVFQKGKTVSHQLSASGGSDKTTFYTSLSFLNQEGVVIETGLKRYNGRINITHTDKNVKIGANLSGGWSVFNGTNEGDQSVASPLNTVVWALPYEKPFDDNGAYTVSIQNPFWLNPIEELKVNKDDSYQLKGTGNVFLEYKLPWVKNLTYKINAGGDYSQVENFNITLNGTQRAANTAPNPTRENGEITRALDRRFRYTVTNSLSYQTYLDKQENHNITATLFTEFVKSTGRSFGYTGYGLLLPFRNEAAITPGTNSNNFIPVVNGPFLANGAFPANSALMSYFGVVDYAFKNRYFLSLTGRTDESSRLSPKNRTTRYGSVGGAWLVSDESFFNVNAINFLKLRASYGSVGNQNGIGEFPYLQQYGRGTYAGAGTLQINRLGNDNLTWEKRRTVNIGIDAELLKSRIRASIEVYNSLTKDLYFSPRVPATSGGGLNILANAGKMENKGIELSLGFKIVDKKDFKWSIDANYAYNKNNIKELPDGQTFLTYQSFQALQVGKPFGSFYLVEFLGVDPANGNSLYKDVNTKAATNVYDPANLAVLGTADAPHNGGLTNTISYKGIELSTFFVFAAGNYVYNNARYNVEFNAYTTSGFARNGLNAWTAPGQVTNFPRISETTESQTTRFLEKGDFWRLRNIMLSYNLPKMITDKLKIQGARFFIQGQNLYSKFKFQGWDPEVSSVVNSDANSNAAVSGAQYPPLKTITAGFNITF